MAATVDRNGRATRIAGILLAGLFAAVILANVLWPAARPADPAQPRLPATASPFPSFRMGSLLHAVSMDPDANLSTRVLMTSLQGLVNRAQVELYLDVEGVAGNTSEMLSFLGSRYNVAHDVLSMQAAIDRYAPRTAGLVVVDPLRSESVSIGTMIAALRDGALVGPDLVGWMRARYNLPVLFDYASSDWASLGPIGAYDRALRELYPLITPTLLSILPPDRWAIRDYLIATRTFVFYLPQGILASPFETAATRRILHAAPRGIPIIGWFDTPTLTEENAFVQMASAEGKFVVGVQDLPNLSVLTAIGRNATHRQRAPPSPSATALGDKTYVVLAVSDGDNVDFVEDRMRDLWSEPVRGTLPIVWSLNPLLVDLAPPILDRYYDSASPLDRFIAAPSGAGYMYPDYASREDLSSYVALSKRYLTAADMDVVWLLNAFVASEIPYTSASLSTYVDGIRPDGIVLDYDDQPKARDAWVQEGTQDVAPVVRSTHFYTTYENALGKLQSVVTSANDGPRFVWLTIYTFRFDLNDARALVDTLSNRVGGRLEVVDPGRFFSFLRQDFVRTARSRLASTQADPFASLFFRSWIDSAASRLRDADAYVAANDSQRGAYAAFLGLEDLRSVSAAEAVVASLLVVLAAGVLGLVASRASGQETARRTQTSFGALVFVLAAVALLTYSLREAVQQNFWTYPSIILGVAVAGIHRPLRQVLERAYPERAPVAAAIALLLFTALAIRTTVAFPLAMIGALLAIDTYLARSKGSSIELLLGLLFGTAVGFLGGFDLPTFTVLAVVLVATAVLTRGIPRPAPPATPSALLVGLMVALPLSALSVGFYYSMGLLLGLQGDLPLVVGGALLVLAPTLGALAWRAVPHGSPQMSEVVGLAVAAIFGGAVLVANGPIPNVLALLGLFASLAFAAIAALDRFASVGGDPRRTLAIAILLLPLFVLFFRMPPVVYSLALVALPEGIEYALYTPPVMISATALVLAVGIGLGSRFRPRVEKDYPADTHRGEGPQ